MIIAQRERRDYAPRRFSGLEFFVADRARHQAAARQQSGFDSYGADDIGATFAVKLPLGAEARAEGIPSWLAWLGTLVLGGLTIYGGYKLGSRR